MSSPAHRLVEPILAVVIGAQVLAVIVAIVVPGAYYVAGVLAIAAGLIGMVGMAGPRRLVGLILIGVGLVALVIAFVRGAHPEPAAFFSLNQDLIGMIAAVGFLGLLARERAEYAVPRLSGAPAVWRTAAVAHLLGAVINLSAMTVMGDHLKKPDGTLRPADSMILTRGIASAAAWSPFFAATAAAAIVAPGAEFVVLVPIGLGFAIATLAASMFTVTRSLGDELPDYRGFAFSWPLLRIPLAVAVVVVGLHFATPGTPVPRLVALAAVAVTFVVLLISNWRRAPRQFIAEARRALPAVRGEVTLFASAAFMAIGIEILLGTFAIHLPFATFSVFVAWLCIVAMIALSFVGIHPVISLGLIGVLVAPLHPSPTLLALALVIGWGTGAGIGPLSGMQLYLQGRYNVVATATTVRNLPYMIAALALAWPALFLAQWLAGGR